MIDCGRTDNSDVLSGLTDDRVDARKACDKGVEAPIDVLTIDAFRDAEVIFQIARLDGKARDESDLLVLIAP